MRYADRITELFQELYLLEAKFGRFSKTWNVMTRPKTFHPIFFVNEKISLILIGGAKFGKLLKKTIKQ